MNRRRQVGHRPPALSTLSGVLLLFGASGPGAALAQGAAAEGVTAPRTADVPGSIDLSTCQAGQGEVDADLLSEVAVTGGAALSGDTLDRLRLLVQAAPKHAPAQFYLAVAEASEGNMKRARSAAEAAYALDTGCAPFARLAGDMREAGGELRGAAEAWARVVAVYPEDHATRRDLADALIATGQREAAIPHLERLAKAYPDDAALLVELGTAKAWAKDAEGAVEALDRARALDPKALGGEAWKAYGLSLRAVSRPADAVSALTQALDMTPKAEKAERSSVLQSLGWCHLDLKQPDAALSAFEAASKLTPGDANIWASVARAYNVAGRIDQAVAPYQKAISLSPKDKALRLEAAQVIAAKEDKRGIAVDILDPIATGPGAEARYTLAQAEILSWMPERRGEAIARADAALKADPSSAEAAKILRDAVVWSEPGPQLVEPHTRLAVLFPEDDALRAHRAECLSKTPGRQAEALPIYTELLERAPEDALLRLKRAELALTLSAAPPAELTADLRRVSRDLPEDALAQKRAADALMELKDYEGALVAYDRALARRPKDVYVLAGKAKAQEELGQISAAKETLDQALAAAKTPAEEAAVKAQQRRLDNLSLVTEARRLQGEGKLAEAEELRLAYTNANPSDPNGWTGLGGVRAERREFEWALKAYNKALALDPRHVEALRGAAGASLALGRYDEAEAFLKREQAIAPSPDVSARLEAARLARELAKVQGAVDKGRYDAALSALAKLYIEQPEDASIAKLYGQALLEVGRLGESADAYTRAVSLAPDDLEALRGQALALWKSGRREEARDALARARTLAPASEATAIDEQLLYWDLEIAEELKASGRTQRAFEYYRRAYERAPDADYVLSGLAGLYWSNHQVDLASKYFTRAVQLNPKNTGAAVGAAETLLAQGKADVAYSLLKDSPARKDPEVRAAYNKVVLARDLMAVERAWEQGERSVALDVAEDVARRHPGQLEPWQRLARLSLREGRYVDALTYYQRALAINPDSESDLYGTIATLQAMGRHGEAARLISQARTRQERKGSESEELDRLEAAGWAARGEAHKTRGELRSAFAAYQRAMELAPGTPWVLAGMAGVYAKNGQLEASLDLYDEALRVEPRDPGSLDGQATVLLGLGRGDEAAGPIRALREIEGDTPRVQRLEARQARESGQVAEAIRLFEEMYEEGSEDPSTAEGLASAYLRAGQPAIALDLIARELLTTPNDVDLLRLAAGSLRSLGRSDLAVPVYRKVAIYWPSERSYAELEAAFLGAYVEAAEAAKARGDDDQAEALYQEALSRDPENGEILRSLGGLEAREGNTDEALAYFDAALDADPEDPWAIVGYANMKAAEGDAQGALRVLERGWRDTQDPWVGLNRARLLIEQERFGEARRQLEDVEEVIAEQKAVRTSGQELARQYGRSDDAARVVERFQSTWARIARVEPQAETAGRSGETLPLLTSAQLRGPASAAKAPAEGGTRPTAKLTLPDVDPTLPTATELVSMPTGPQKETAPGAVDLGDVERLLAELRRGQDERGQAKGRREEAPRPVLTFEDDLYGALPPEEARPEPDALPPSDLVYETDTFAPFEPTVSRRGPARKTEVADAPDPAEYAAELRRDIEDQTASSLYVAGGVDGRTGSPGTTALVAAMGDIQLHLRPTEGLTIFGYGAPVVATNIIETQTGFGVGGGFYAKPGPVDLRLKLGSSPIGFLGGPYLVGAGSIGLEAIPRLSIGVEVAREEVRDSLLSWGGLIDAESGQLFGQVSRDRLSLQATFFLDSRAQLTLAGDVANYSGTNVLDNRWRQGRVDARYLTWRDEEQNVWLGIDGIFFSFEQQLDRFEPPYGGYFSPEVFLMTRARLYYEGLLSEERLRMKAHGGIGVQFTDGVETDYLAPGIRPALTAGLLLGYRLSRGLEIGLKYEFDNAGANYTRNTGWLYLEKRFGVDGDF